MSDITAVLLFWLPAGLMVYNWFGFPLLLLLVTRLRRKEQELPPFQQLPTVTVAIAAWNEERHIADKIRNCLDFDYPADRLEVIVGTDAVTDRTNEIVRGFDDPRVKLYAVEERLGKSAVVNMLAVKAEGEIVLFTDADVRMARDALRLGVERFRDAGVGVVLPLYRRVNAQGYSAEGLWDKYENKLKELEGELGSAVGAYGWAMFVRRSSFGAIPPDTVLDDYAIAVGAFRRGYSAVYEAGCVSETRVETPAVEFSRKARNSRGSAQAFLRYSGVLLPKYGVTAWVYFSHKYIRWFVPVLLVMMLVGSATELGTPFFAVVFWLQVVAYLTTPLVLVTRGALRGLLVVQYYLYANAALVAGYWQFLFGRRLAYNWFRTKRDSD
ncbi:MAG: glycosyltransferase [candidate division WOR-3 bacterium]|nr:MAG: glycosyltransferase [candidate division WOR-3 bacterium]